MTHVQLTQCKQTAVIFQKCQQTAVTFQKCQQTAVTFQKCQQPAETSVNSKLRAKKLWIHSCKLNIGHVPPYV